MGEGDFSSSLEMWEELKWELIFFWSPRKEEMVEVCFW